MTLYHWKSEFFRKGMSAGDILVPAESVEEARNIAILSFMKIIRNPNDNHYNCLDQKKLSQFANVFQKDIDEEPEIVTNRAIFIEGKEI